MYQISYDADAHILALRMEGFWTSKDVEAFATALMAKAAELQTAGRSFHILSDSRDFPIQSTEVSETIHRLTQGGADMIMGRTAVIVGTTLSKLQAERILSHPRLRVFRDIDEARNWLQSDPAGT